MLLHGRSVAWQVYARSGRFGQVHFFHHALERHTSVPHALGLVGICHSQILRRKFSTDLKSTHFRDENQDNPLTCDNDNGLYESADTIQSAGASPLLENQSEAATSSLPLKNQANYSDASSRLKPDQLFYHTPEQPSNPQSLRVGIVGAPNVGKSTLINSLMGVPLMMVSKRQQATTEQSVGIITEANMQLLLLDTPGLLNKEEVARFRASKTIATGGPIAAAEADLVLAIVDGSVPFTKAEATVLGNVLRPARKCALVVNKADLALKKRGHEGVRTLMTHVVAMLKMPFDARFVVSALSGDGVGDLKRYLETHCEPRPWAYPKEMETDMTPLKRLTEMVRERLLELREEIPYVTRQKNLVWEEDEDGVLIIHHQLIVGKKSQKEIIEGRGFANLKAMETDIANGMANLYHVPVRLTLSVKARPGARLV